MKFSLLNRLYKVLPNGTLNEPVLGASYITDKKGNIIGHIDFKTTELFVAESYPHCDAVCKRFDGAGLNYEIKKYDELLKKNKK